MSDQNTSHHCNCCDDDPARFVEEFGWYMRDAPNPLGDLKDHQDDLYARWARGEVV